jgi:hypothetical protein
MRELRVGPARVELRALVAEASQALALLDAARLEELALCCELVNRDLALGNMDDDARKVLAQQAREAQANLAVFGRVLDATRANLNVMKRLREIRLGQLEYSAQWGAIDCTGTHAEAGSGNH